MERRRGRPPKTGDFVERVSVAYRFAPDTVKALKKAARKHKTTQTEYVERTLLRQLERDGIIKPKKEDAHITTELDPHFPL
jgi:ribosomal protein S19E (S16A)